jgi:hypothetical protein
MPTPAPTYAQFRAMALAKGWSPEFVAQHTQADDPLKAAERLLVHLAGTHWDDAPLPYPQLCALYAGGASAPAPPPVTVPPRPRLHPHQVSAKRDFGEFDLHVTLDADAPREGVKAVSHAVGGRQLSDDAYRLPYAPLCRLAARQHRDAQPAAEEVEAEANAGADRHCACGTPLTGQASQRFCSARCRQRASRANPSRIAKARGSKSVTAMIPPPCHTV